MKRLGIKAKLALHSAVILTALGAAVTLYSLSQLRTVIYQEMFQRIEAQALNWIEANTAQIILNGDPRTLNRLVNELKQLDSVSYVILADDQRHENSSASPPPDLAEVARWEQESDCPPLCWKQTQDATGVRYFELTASISAAGTGMSPDLGTLFGAAAGNTEWGELRIGVNRRAFDQRLNGLIAKNVFLATALIATAIVVSFALAKPVVTPIVLLARTANQIAAGNLSQRVQQGANLRDEVGDLVRNFNRMALRLEENRAEMSSLHSQLENKVHQRTQALEEANRQLKEIAQLKSNFISTVSHELRTPLTSIKAYAEILLDASNLDATTVGHFLDVINQEAERMSRLIANLLSLKKIESGTTVWFMNRCDLERIIRTAVVVLAPGLAAKDISVKLHLKDRLTVWADADRIQEVLTNLVSNGIRFCSHGGHIIIRTNRTHVSGPSGTPGEYVQIEVCDDGPGIAPPNASAYLTSSTRAAARPPAGRASDWPSRAKSCSITGAKSGSYPRTMAEPASFSRCLWAPRAVRVPQKVCHFKRRKRMAKTVLVCDDEPYILESVSYVVREEGYNVLTAESGEDALRLAHSAPLDMVILDISLPRKDGHAVCRELKSGAATQKIYIIVLTAKGQERDMEESARCGADEFVTKPFSPRKLRKRLHEVLD